MPLKPATLAVCCLLTLAAHAVAQRPSRLPPSGTLVINCQLDGAPHGEGKIYLDGQEAGACPRTERPVVVGTHAVRVGQALGNNRYLVYENERVEVLKDRTREITAELSRRTGQQAPALAFALGARKLSSIRPPEDSKITAFSPDATVLAVGAETNSVRLYNVADGRPLRRLGAPGEYWVSFVTALSFSADGRLLASDGWLYDKYVGEINLWDVASGRLLRTIHGVEKVSALALSPDGGLLAAGVAPGTLKLWGARDGKPRWAVKLPGELEVGPLLFSADGRMLVAGLSGGDEIFVYDVLTAELRRTLPGRLVALAEDGRVFTYSSENDQVTRRVWRSLTGEPMESRQAACFPSAFGLGERLLVCDVELRDARDWRLLLRLTDHPRAVSADGRRLLVNAGDYVVWSLPSLPR